MFPITDEYLLDHNYAAASRLNLQISLWKHCLRFNIHPDISIPWHRPYIADIATGTAMWLLDVADEVPTSLCNGFDIDLTQCPPEQRLPKNVQIRTWNMLSEVPEDLLGKYDLVHVRLVILAIQSDPGLFVSNLKKMLKTGGYLQWDEIDPNETEILITKPDVGTAVMEKLEFSLRRGGTWIPKLASTLEEHGFVDVKRHLFRPELRFAKAETDVQLVTMDELAALQSPKVGSQIRQLVAGSYQESLKGAALCVLKVVYTAKVA